LEEEKELQAIIEVAAAAVAQVRPVPIQQITVQMVVAVLLQQSQVQQ